MHMYVFQLHTMHCGDGAELTKLFSKLISQFIPLHTCMWWTDGKCYTCTESCKLIAHIICTVYDIIKRITLKCSANMQCIPQT